ncbi:MAG: SpoIIE family protein phosphatase [Spirochaetales bacterium]|nr:SpoIIE family protein phosphatase [Spirochaetales bacterium]
MSTKEKYQFIRTDIAQAEKQGHPVCGDLVTQHRTLEETIIILIDGIGSGIKANVAAHLYASRLMELLKNGFSLREAVSSVVKTIHKARTSEVLFAAFSIARILNTGDTTILSYEIAPPIFIEHGFAYVAETRPFTAHGEIIKESHFSLEPGKQLLLVSDGITQAGIGNSLPLGWGEKGIADYVNRKTKQGIGFSTIPQKLLEKSKELSDNRYQDDSTAIIISCQQSHSIHILTGPPENRQKDNEIVKKFLDSNGVKVICGSTTAEILAREAGKKVEIKTNTGSYCSPPEYKIKGIDLVTEGALVLNQLYNILEEDPDSFDPSSCVSELGILLHAVDIIHIWLGQAENPGYKDNIAFTQMGILRRKQIIPLIAEKLRSMGKLVVVHPF